MDNFSEITNITLKQVTNLISANSSNFTNSSEVTQTDYFDLYEAYRTKEREQLGAYRSVAYLFGTIIFLSNLTVVISSGLILKKGQQPKSTYLLLGNVSLADTIVGISIIFGASIENSTNSSNPLCIFQIGMLVCPAMVSIFSVGMIAVDRYIYILHGLYYQRWFSTTKVRIGILCIWMIGIILGFLPASGWVNNELIGFKCSYVSLFPGTLILLNSLLSIVPIVLVAALYSIILVHALRNVKEINRTMKSVKIKSSNDKPEMRMYRGNINIKPTCSVKIVAKNNNHSIKRSASFDMKYISNPSGLCKETSKSIHDLKDKYENFEKDNDCNISSVENKRQSNISVSSDSTCSVASTGMLSDKQTPCKSTKTFTSCKERVKEPNKWRAVIIVMLTTGSFVFTWIPFFITVIFFVFCEEKTTNIKCFNMNMLLKGPIGALAFCNSILNPLIYAWWHKGFQRSIKTYFRKYFKNIFKSKF